MTTTTEKFTRREYAMLPEGFNAFLLDGSFVREAAPGFRHQSAVLDLAVLLRAAAPQRVLVAPTDVIIDDWNVLQPDVVAFGPEIVDVRTAAPESVPVLVAEVLSAGTAKRDRSVKTPKYLAAGIAEVWLVDLDTRSIEIVTAEGVSRFDENQTAVSSAVPGFAVRVADLAPPRA